MVTLEPGTTATADNFGSGISVRAFGLRSEVVSGRPDDVGALRPMLSTPGPLPIGPAWAFEFAWEGVRAIAHLGPDGPRLHSTTGRDVTGSFPELTVLGAPDRAHRLVVDGVLVALDSSGRPDAGRLRRRLAAPQPSEWLRREVPVAYVLLDLLCLDDHAVHRLPLRQRRELLAELELASGPVVLPPSFPAPDGPLVRDTAAAFGLPGVWARRLDVGYQLGRRSPAWVHTMLRRRQQVVLGGWVPGRDGIVRSLLVGVPDRHGLRFAAAVGTGLSGAQRRGLAELLAGWAIAASPFVDELPTPLGRPARWVRPGLVGQVEHRRWSEAGRLVHPSWRGLRPDVDPTTVHAEATLPPPASTPSGPSAPALVSARTDVQHFLYNTLTAIASYVRTDPDTARELLANVADYTRYALRAGDEPTTLGEELRNVERYLDVQQARFGDRLRASVVLTPELAGLAVAPLTVQALVEAAVRRVEATPGGGKISVTASPHGSGSVVTVWDDAPVAGSGGRGGTTRRLRLAR